MTSLRRTPWAHALNRLSLPFMLLMGNLVHAAEANKTCQSNSPTHQVQVVELYTSEGCDSCPPADRWLSTLKGRRDVLAAAFHVDYWDRLGWTDRFGHPSHTRRQAQSNKFSGASFSYTPQVLLNGRDWRRWPQLPVASVPAVVSITLQRVSDAGVSLNVTLKPGAPADLGLWWAVLEDGHVTAVKAGENRGATLRHDHVVRTHGQHAAWRRDDHASMQLALPFNAGKQSRLLVVVVDASTGFALQATTIDC